MARPREVGDEPIFLRIWRTGVDTARLDEYRAFAKKRSLPMFRQQHGFLGVLFAESERGCAVLSLWRNRASLDALDKSSSYRATVKAILSAGFLTGRQEVEVFEVTGGHLHRINGNTWFANR